jgi:hypothetical protein
MSLSLVGDSGSPLKNSGAIQFVVPPPAELDVFLPVINMRDMPKSASIALPVLETRAFF